MSKKLPVFKGLSWHRNQYYSFFVPSDWHKNAWPDGRQGIIYHPPVDDPFTLLAIEVWDLGTPITPDDLDDLYDGFLTGVRELPGCEVESHEHWIRGDLMCLEARYSFAEQDHHPRRWVRQFYHQTRQIAFTAQGSTHEVFDYWMPMFFEIMMTTQIHSTVPEPDADLAAALSSQE